MVANMIFGDYCTWISLPTMHHEVRRQRVIEVNEGIEPTTNNFALVRKSYKLMLHELFAIYRNSFERDYRRRSSHSELKVIQEADVNAKVDSNFPDILLINDGLVSVVTLLVLTGKSWLKYVRSGLLEVVTCLYL